MAMEANSQVRCWHSNGALRRRDRRHNSMGIHTPTFFRLERPSQQLREDTLEPYSGIDRSGLPSWRRRSARRQLLSLGVQV